MSERNATRDCWCACREEITATLVELLCGESAFLDLGSEIHRFRCANPDCRHLSIPKHFTPRDNDAASACLQWLRGVLAGAFDVAPHREGSVMSESRYRQHRFDQTARLLYEMNGQSRYGRDLGGWDDPESTIGRNQYERDYWLRQAATLAAAPPAADDTVECATCSGRGVWMDEPCVDCAPFCCYPCARGDHDEHKLAWVPDIPRECPKCASLPGGGL